MTLTDDLTRTEDLTDPKVLRVQCEEFAAGLDQQAIAASHRNAFQGHPQPAFFFGRIATILRAAAAFAAQFESAPPTPAPIPVTTESGGKKK